MSAVGVVPLIIGMLVGIGSYLLGKIDGNRLMFGLAVLAGLIESAVAVSYGSLRYHVGGVVQKQIE